jgi:hypothetical protein
MGGRVELDRQPGGSVGRRAIPARGDFRGFEPAVHELSGDGEERRKEKQKSCNAHAEYSKNR